MKKTVLFMLIGCTLGIGAFWVAGNQLIPAETHTNSLMDTESMGEYLLVEHEVSDYLTWREAFDGHEPARHEGGLQTLRIFRSSEDPNKVAVLAAVTNPKKAFEYMHSRGVQEVVKKSGVVGRPSIKWVRGHDFPTTGPLNSTMTYLIIHHQVEDYARWASVFEAHETKRLHSGVQTLHVLQDFKQEDRVTVLLAVKDLPSALAYANSEEQVDAMQEAGVIDELEVNRYHLVNGATTVLP